MAPGAFFRQRSTIAFRPSVTSATLASSPASLPTLLVPARSTMTLGLTPSSSPFSRRQRMFSVRSPPQPKLPAFQPRKVFVPMGEEVRVVEGAPAARDGVAQEVEIDAAALGLGQELLVGEVGVVVAAHPRLLGGNGRRSVAEQSVRPGDEEAHVGAVLVSTVVLAPRELAVEQAGLHGRHLRHAVVLGDARVPRPEQAEDRAGRHRGHVAALLIEPVGVALLGDAVADEGRARRAQGDELVRVDRNVAGVLAPEGRLGGAVLQEVAGHPVVLRRTP